MESNRIEIAYIVGNYNREIPMNVAGLQTKLPQFEKMTTATDID